MTRQSTVALHPQVTRINTMLDDGVPYATIAREMGLKTSSVGRWALARKSELAKALDGEPTTTDVLSRLVEAADHARDARRQAKLTGSPVHQARMIKAEADVLTKLLDELGVQDTSLSEAFEEMQGLARALSVLIRTEPDAASALLKVARQVPALESFARTLATRLGASDDN